MSLSSDLISQFVKATKDNKKTKKETITYGNVEKIEDGTAYVKLDGSEVVTPVSTTVGVEAGNRVIVMVKNHTATITGNLSDPSAKNTQISDLGTVVADKISTEQFNSEVARIDKLNADYVNVDEKLTAYKADIDDLKAKDATIEGKLEANEAEIGKLSTDKIDATVANAKFATIDNLNSTNTKVYNLEATHGEFATATTTKLEAVDADIDKLNSDKLSTEDADIKYANIDFSNIDKAAIEAFFSKSGMIADLVVGEQTITGKLVGVTISGDLIEANTVKAEKLVVKGSDGLYYKLNIEAGATMSEQVSEADLQNGLHGTAIIAKTITAEKISVDDLVAFGATIGGFTITDDSLYSGVKDSVNNTTRGTYLDDDGQVAFGDGTNFFKYYKDSEGNYKLIISASSLILSSSNKSVEEAISDVQKSVDDIEVGGRNLFQNSKDCSGWVHNDIVTFEPAEEDGFTIINFGDVASASYNRVAPTPNIPYSVVRNKTITISLYVRADNNQSSSSYSNSILCSIGIATSATGARTLYKDYWLKDANGYYALPTEWEKRSLTLNITDSIFSSGTGEITDDSYFVVNFYRYNLSGAQLKAPKLEIGNKPTDWTPAPEDMATSDEVNHAQDTADNAKEKAANAETLIAQLADSISMLVTDGNGTSLMTQTEDGWTFSTANIQESVNSISETLHSLTSDVGDTANTVEILEQAVADLGEIAEYVKITTYEDEPCIELGEGDSDFKLRITNTRMMFTDGSTVLAYFNNKAFQVKKVIIEDELQQGGFVWKARSNGNLGLMWKGGNN